MGLLLASLTVATFPSSRTTYFMVTSYVAAIVQLPYTVRVIGVTLSFRTKEPSTDVSILSAFLVQPLS